MLFNKLPPNSVTYNEHLFLSRTSMGQLGFCFSRIGLAPGHGFGSGGLQCHLLSWDQCTARDQFFPRQCLKCKNSNCTLFKNTYILLIIYYSCPISPPLFPSGRCWKGSYTSPPTRILLTLTSCPWVIHINSLASPFPILFLTSPCLFCTDHLYFLFPVPFPPFSFLPLPADNSPCALNSCESVPF